MTSSQGVVRAIVISILALTSALPTAAQEPSGSPSRTDRLAAEVSAELALLTPPEAISAAAERLAAADAERLAAIDPELPAILAELDALAAEELAAYLAEVPPLAEGSPDPGASPDPGSSPEPQPEGRPGMSFLSAVGPRLPEQARRFDQGGSFLGTSGQMAGFIDGQIGGFQPSKGGARLPDRPFEGTSTQTVAGRQVSRSTRYAISGASDRDTVTLAIQLTEEYAIPGPTPDGPLLAVSDSGEVTIVVDTCPDEDGTIVAHTATQGSVDVTGPGVAYRVVFEATDRAVATVDDEASVSGREHSLDSERHATGNGPFAAGGGGGSVDSHVAANLSWTSDGTGDARSTFSIEVSADEGATQADVSAWLFGGVMTGSIADMAIDAAERVWRDGRCLELKADPRGMDVDRGSETDITVRIAHKAYDEEVERPVRATLAGPEKVEPLDSPVMAPAEFTYTATSEASGDGVITFRSVSNRGIAEVTETYRVDQRLLLDVEGKLRVDMAMGEANLTVKGRGLKVTLVPGEPPGVTIEGTLRIQGPIVQPLPLGRRCVGRYRQTVEVDPGVGGSATLSGEPEDRRVVIHLRPASRDTVVSVRMRCPGITMDTEQRGGDFLSGWSSSVGPADLPLTGGTVRVRGKQHSFTGSGSITLRRAR